MGPLRTTDIVVRLAICEHLAREWGSQFEPPEILRFAVPRQKGGPGRLHLAIQSRTPPPAGRRSARSVKGPPIQGMIRDSRSIPKYSANMSMVSTVSVKPALFSLCVLA